MQTKTTQSDFAIPPRSGVLHWKNLMAVCTVLAIFVSIYRYFDTLHSGAVVAYILYPVSIACLALLLYTRPFAKFPEVRLLGVFFAWALVVIVLNMNRAEGVLASGWFYSLCTMCFLCFSLPYAFEGNERLRVLRILLMTSALLASLLSAAGVLFAATGRVAPAHTGVEGVFGIGSDARLWLFCHPNSAAPICGIGAVACAYLFLVSKRRGLRFLYLLPFAFCFAALALTDSRAGILAAAIALGAEVFFGCAANLLQKKSRVARVLLSLLLAAAVMALTYQGTAWIRTGLNAYTAARASASSTAETAASAAQESAPNAVSSRDLSDFSNFNGRTAIWKATFHGLSENRSILFSGTTPLISGELMSPYFPANAPRGNFHNSLIAILVSLGLPGLSLFLALLVLLLLRCCRFVARTLFDRTSLHARLITALLLFTLAESMMEQFLFVDGMPSVVWVWFMLAAGYTFAFGRDVLAAAPDVRRDGTDQSHVLKPRPDDI